jgi:hypothetical protein
MKSFIKTINIFLLFFTLQQHVIGQTLDQFKISGLNSENNAFVILKIELGSMMLISDSQVVDLKDLLKIKQNPKDPISFNEKLTFAGLNFLDKQGYELVSSHCVDTYREFFHRRKINRQIK